MEARLKTALRSGWPGLVVLAFAVFLGWPLWHAGQRLFLTQIDTDSATTLWYYDLIARHVFQGMSIDRLTELDWPTPLDREREFPSIADALLAAPLALLADLPRRWGMVLAFSIAVNGLGGALLARGAGARGWGVVVGGALAAAIRTVWSDYDSARMNAVWPGLAAGAVGAWLWAVEVQRLLPALLAVLFGVGAALVYPVYLPLLVPMVLFVRVRPRWRTLLWMVVPVAVALTLTGGMLGDLWASRAGQPCQSVTCPDPFKSLDAVRLALPRPVGSLGLRGFLPGTWVLAPLALLHHRRKAALVVLLSVVALAALSVGPCPRLSGQPLQGFNTQGAPWLWCSLSRVTDYGRLATAGALMAAALAGLAVTRLRWLGVVLGLAVVGWTTWGLMSDVLQPRSFVCYPTSQAAAFLRDADAGPVLELPFDRSGQFLSIIQAPGRPRLNPLKPDRRSAPLPAIRWLHALAHGTIGPGPDLHHSGLRWVIYDAERCSTRSAVQGGCSQAVIDALTEALGQPEQRGDLLIWSAR